MALVNVWHSRRVAEASAKPCDICFKSTTAVLITPDNKDHFYVCITHLKDKSFASPIIDPTEAAEKKRKEQIEIEKAQIIKDYEERVKKRAKNKEKKEKGEGKDQDKKDEDEDAKALKEKDDKIKAISDQSTTAAADDTPRIYSLQNVFFRRRVDRLRNVEIARRNQERMKNPSLFPTVPTGNP